MRPLIREGLIYLTKKTILFNITLISEIRSLSADSLPSFKVCISGSRSVEGECLEATFTSLFFGSRTHYLFTSFSLTCISCLISFILFFPHSYIISTMGSKVIPSSVMEYSTFGGISGYTSRWTMPSSISSRN